MNTVHLTNTQLKALQALVESEMAACHNQIVAALQSDSANYGGSGLSPTEYATDMARNRRERIMELRVALNRAEKE